MILQTQLPRWLEVLLEEKFFESCLIHEIQRKNEKNILCLDCCIAICPHCLAPHSSHRLLQIRRYVYHEVIRLDDAQKLMDCSSVQAYINNGAKAVFLNERPQSRPFRASGNVCINCHRCLQDPFLFCSISCKVMHLMRTEGDISKYLLECNYLPLSGSSEIEDGQINLDSSGSTGGGNGGLMEWFKTVGVGSTAEIVKKKRSSLTVDRSGPGPVCSQVEDSPASGLMNRRRKSCNPPHRSPLY